MSIAKPTDVRAESVNDTVVLKIGNAEMTFSYKDAFMLSDWLKHTARKSKRFAGDFSTNWNVFAELSTVEQNFEDYIKPNARYTAPKGVGGGT